MGLMVVLQVGRSQEYFRNYVRFAHERQSVARSSFGAQRFVALYKHGARFTKKRPADAGRDGDAIVRPFEAGMALWKAGFYVRFGGDTLQFGPTFNSKPQDLDRLFDAVGEVLNKID